MGIISDSYCGPYEEQVKALRSELELARKALKPFAEKIRNRTGIRENGPWSFQFEGVELANALETYDKINKLTKGTK